MDPHPCSLFIIRRIDCHRLGAVPQWWLLLSRTRLIPRCYAEYSSTFREYRPSETLPSSGRGYTILLSGSTLRPSFGYTFRAYLKHTEDLVVGDDHFSYLSIRFLASGEVSRSGMERSVSKYGHLCCVARPDIFSRCLHPRDSLKGYLGVKPILILFPSIVAQDSVLLGSLRPPAHLRLPILTA